MQGPVAIPPIPVAYLNPPRAPRRAPRVATQVILVIILLVFAVGHAIDIGLFREHWPFSNYPMYAGAKPKTTYVFEVWGVLETPGKRGVTEVKMQRSGEFSVPLAGFKRLYGKLNKAKDRKRTYQALVEFHRSYDYLRTQRGHPGPPLKGMRLYRATWTLKPDAGNAAVKPDLRELLLDTTDPSTARRGPTTVSATRPAGPPDPTDDDGDPADPEEAK